jgi:hypothetical protein
MEVDIITKKQLEGFINGELFNRLTVLPISSLRANYFLHANHIADSDPLIVLVRDGFEMLSFAVFLPDTTRWGQKFAWNSGWWVHPQKGKPYALLPLIKGIDLWHERVAFADLPGHSANILKALNRFRFLPSADGVKLILRPYLPKSQTPIRHLQLFDTCGKLFSPLGHLGLNPDKFELQSIDCHNIDCQKDKFGKSNIGLTLRNGDDFATIVKHPWLSTQPQSVMDEVTRFPFSLVTEQFDICFFQLSDNGNRVGTLILKIRDGHLNIAYLATAPNHIAKAVNTVIEYAVRHGLKSVIVFRPDLATQLLASAPFFAVKRTITSQTAFGMGLDLEKPNNLMLHDGEGDCIFT